MIYNISAMSTDLITNEGILDLFKYASWENLLFFVLFAAVIVFGANRLTKPQKELQREQNSILKDFASSIGNLVKNNAVEERSQNERHDRYMSEFGYVKELISTGFTKTDSDLKEINDTLIHYTATRCSGDKRSIKEVILNETNEK